MKQYNFDEIIDRKGTNALKTDVLTERFGRADLIPLWVADMDFKSPQEITDAIIDRAKHGVFGYTQPSQEYYDSIVKWLEKQHKWNIQRNWITFVPGIVKGIACVVDCFTSQNDKVIIQPPVYYPIRLVPERQKRQIVYNPLILEDGQYKMDFDNLIKNIDASCKLFILCNPHNPGGVVWSREELIKLADICYENNIMVLSDEIHSDLAFSGHEHIPFASVSDKAAEISITFMAPSKTFNIAGLVSSYSITSNAELRAKFNYYMESRELNSGDIFAYLAAQVAYQKGEVWLEEVKEYIWNNILYIDEFLKQNIPQIKAIIPQASYLVWLDCRELNLSQSELVSFFINNAKLALNDGSVFGIEGKGFMRLNVGSPLSVIQKALDNLKRAVDDKH